MAIDRGKTNGIRGLGAVLLATTALVAPVAAQEFVTSNGDAGAGTFREAVTTANGSPLVTQIESQLTSGDIVTLLSPVDVTRIETLKITGSPGVPFILTNDAGFGPSPANRHYLLGLIGGGGHVEIDDMVELHTVAAAEPVHAILGTGGSNHITLAGSITTNADNANGIHFLGGNNTLDITGDIKTSGAVASAIDINSGSNIVTVSGAIEVSGDFSAGINLNTGGNMVTLAAGGTITATGNTAGGIYIGSAGGAGGNTVDISGDITVSGSSSHGVDVRGGGNTVNIREGGSIAVGGATIAGIPSGIRTENSTQADPNRITVAGDIRLDGTRARGIQAEGSFNQIVVAETGTIVSGGDPLTDLNHNQRGISVVGDNNLVNVEGAIGLLRQTPTSPLPPSSAGILVTGDANEIVLHAAGTTPGSGHIEIVSRSTPGVFVEGDGNRIDAQGTISTEGLTSSGLSILGGSNDILLSGGIETLGSEAYGVLARGSGNTVILSGDVNTSGVSALGVLAFGSDNTVILSGDIATTGNDANGVHFWAGNSGNRLELHSGFSLAATGTGAALAQGGGNSTLTLGGTDAGSFGISDIGTADGYAGFSNFDKRGSSVWTLIGANNAVDWTVQEGTLLVNGAAGDMEVLSGAALGGSGSVGDTVINAGSRLIGVQGQTLTLASLDLDAASIVDVRLGVPGTTALFNVTTDLTLDGTLNITDLGGFGPGLYRLFDYGGALHGQGFNIGTVPGGTDASDLAVQTAVVGQVNLYYNAGGGGGGDFLFWDGDAAGNGGNGVIDGGDGIWTLANTNWTNVDGTANGAMSPVPGFAVFAGAPGAVTVDDVAGAISVTGMQFATNGYVVSGDAINLAGVGGDAVIRVGDSTGAGVGYTTTIGSVLTGPAQLVKTDLGTLVLAGINTYSGGTQINGGTVQVSQDANLGDVAGGLVMNGGTLATTASFDTNRDVTLLADGQFDVATGTALGLEGDITGSGDLIKQGSGMLLLSGSNAYGDTIVEAGTLAGHSGSISGDIANAGDVIFAQATDGSFAGNIAGLGGTDGIMMKNGAGVLTLTGTSSLDWSIGAGSIVTAAERFTGDATLITGGELVFDQASNAISAILLSGDGTGTFTKTGAGLLTLTGTNGGFTGHTNIDGGTLLVSDALGGTLDVNASGVLAGNGTVGTTIVRNGGTISPGTVGQIDTLHVAGDLTFEAGSTYVVHVEAPDQADLIAVTGTATIDGGAVQLEKLSAETSYMDGQTYRLLTATSLVDNAEFMFNQPFLFLNAELIYGSTFVDLALSRSASFTDSALTFNQFQAATALDGLDQSGDALAVFNELLAMTDADEARRAFDLSSGEIHASGQHVINQTFQLFNRTLRQQAAAGVGNGAAGTVVYYSPTNTALAYGPSNPAGAGLLAIDGATPGYYADERVRAAWAAPLGARGTIDSDGNAGSLDWWTMGLAGGYEGTVDVGSGNAMAGLAFGYLRSGGTVDARHSSMDADGFHLGAYGAWANGPWSFAGSAAYAASHVSTQRGIVVGAINRTAEASYWNHTIGLSTELSYAIETHSGLTISPLFTLDAGWSGHGGYSETGAGALGLTSTAQGYGWLDTGLGIALAHTIETESGKITFDGRAVWEHAFAGSVPGADHLLSGSPIPFSVNGPDAGRDRLRLGAGLAFEIGNDLTIRARYDGLFSGSQQSHAGSVGLNVKF